MKIFKYVLTTKHDNGTINILVMARNKKFAIKTVMACEGCPERSIIEVKRINKYLYGWKLYVNYGHGWEYECFEDSHKSYKENRKAYAENCDYPQKWSVGKELNPSY